jgi:hypothetical protein
MVEDNKKSGENREIAKVKRNKPCFGGKTYFHDCLEQITFPTVLRRVITLLFS